MWRQCGVNKGSVCAQFRCRSQWNRESKTISGPDADWCNGACTPSGCHSGANTPDARQHPWTLLHSVSGHFQVSYISISSADIQTIHRIYPIYIFLSWYNSNNKLSKCLWSLTEQWTVVGSSVLSIIWLGSSYQLYTRGYSTRKSDGSG